MTGGVLDKPLLIAGGGIGGLAAALALSRQGRRVCVLEKAPVLGEIGAGIQLGPNAFHAFDRLGMGDAIRGIAVFVDKLKLIDAMTAEDVAEIALDDGFRARFGNPYAVVHRGELHKAFLTACLAQSNIELTTGTEVVRYEQDEHGVVVFTSDGQTVSGAGLIGADGLWSRVREQMLGDGAPRVSGHTTYRAVIPVEKMPPELRWNAATLWAGPSCHLVHYPLSGGTTFNLVVTRHNDAPRALAGVPVSAEEVAREFAHIHPKAQEIIGLAEEWRMWVLCDREPVERWSDGRVALLGDAAHPMMQYLAQGACMAIEDGVELAASCEASPDDLPAALEAYVARRYLRTARVQLQSREVGRHIYHPDGAHARLRNAVMAGKSADEWHQTLAWLYDTRTEAGYAA